MSEKSGQDTTEQKAPAKRPDRKRSGTRQSAKPADRQNAKPAEKSTGKAAPGRGGTGARQEAKPSGESPPRRGNGGALFLATLALLVAAGTGAAGWYLWQQQRQITEHAAAVESRLQESITGLRADIDSRIQRQAEEIAQASLNGDRQLAARTRELQQAIVDVRSRLGQDRTGWAVSEVEHLLRVANHRLRLARDVQGAEVAIKEADQRLIALGDPAFLPVREAISKELQALRGVDGSDRENAALGLTGLIDAVDTLPVAGPYRAGQREAPGSEESSPARENVSNWREFLDALWTDIRSLVTIRQHEGDGTPTPLLAPQERFFLHQNLRLKLQTARLALLEGHPAIYRSSLAEAKQWLNSYFAEDAAAIHGALATLREVQSVNVSPELPEISESLRVLNRVRERLDEEERSQGAEQAPAAARESDPDDSSEARP